MLVTLKTLQQDTFTIEIDPSQTVRHFKEKIEAVKGEGYAARSMKLMYAGKILVDSNRISDYNIEEKKFVIAVMKQAKKILIKEEEPDSTDAQFLNGSSSNGERDRALRTEHDRLVQHIAELGFSREDVEQALCVSYNNPEQAVEYLINGIATSRCRRSGIPELSDDNLLRHMSEGSSTNRSSLLPSQERIFELFGEAMAECQSHTRAQDRMVEADHERITQSYARMEAAGITNPLGPLGEGLANLNNTFDHASAMSRTFPPVTEMYDVFTDAFTGGFGMGAGLMDHDHEAIERLKRLGFEDDRVIEAYFVCERNENAAADYLFSQKFE